MEFPGRRLASLLGWRSHGNPTALRLGSSLRKL
jgi:hypothetical protein